jgi:phage-related protein
MRDEHATTEGETMTIDTEHATIYGDTGGATYHINDCGGLELDEIFEGGLTDAEFVEVERKLSAS